MVFRYGSFLKTSAIRQTKDALILPLLTKEKKHIKLISQSNYLLKTPLKPQWTNPN